MARYKHYDYDQLMMVPVSLEEQLMPGTLEYAIHNVVEERLDLSMFDARYFNVKNLEVCRDIVEPVFGNIRACKRMDRFTLRGHIKVNIQWMLYGLVHNIEKIMNFGKSYAMSTA